MTIKTPFIRDIEFRLATREAQFALAAWQIAYGQLMRTLESGTCA